MLTPSKLLAGYRKPEHRRVGIETAGDTVPAVPRNVAVEERENGVVVGELEGFVSKRGELEVRVVILRGRKRRVVLLNPALSDTWEFIGGVAVEAWTRQRF